MHQDRQTEHPVALFTTGVDTFSPDNISVVAEGNIVVSDLPRMPDAVILLFGLIYVFSVHYPKKLIHLFTFIHKIVMFLDDNKPLKPCLLESKNDLLQD